MSEPPRTAGAIAAAVRSGAVPAATVAGAALAAAARYDGLNAFTLLEHESALARASEIDAAVAAGVDPGPLAGVPVAVKDLIDHAGRTTTAGSSFLRSPASRTAPAITRLEAAGVVVIGRTGLHEFAFGFSSENSWFGAVGNPWDPATSPGGSSGGSGAAVAAGIVPLALGTDTGGSVRVPAALCGLFGFKPTYGRIPLDGVFPLAATIDTVGPLATTVSDLVAAYRVLSGDPADAGSCDLGRLRIGLPHPWLERPIDPAIDGAFRDALASTGATIVDVTVSEFDPPGAMAASFGYEVATVHRAWFTADPERYGPEVRRRLARAMAVTRKDYEAALAWRSQLQASAAAVFAGVDFLATPTVAVLRKPIGVTMLDVAGHRLHYQEPLSVFTGLVNHALLPAVAVPLAAAGSPPPSLQLIGPTGADDRVLAAAAALEIAGIARFRPPASSAPA